MLRTIIAGLIAATALLSATAAQAVERTIELRDITEPLVPINHTRGDREFGGNGPLMRVQTELRIADHGRQIVAQIYFHAMETGGDGSTVNGTWRNRVVWRARGPERVLRIISAAREQGSAISARGADPFAAKPAGQRLEDGGGLNRITTSPGGYVNAIYAVGDTTGDDISTDRNPHGDTSIRYIDFGRLQVDMNR